MPITILPEGTSRVLRSAQVMIKPAFLIKELIDNAIDAKASSIDILISPNTLDKIEVRDNGHGIEVDDLDALGRHGYTSKLRNIEELRTISRSSLGFRGEALASAVEFGEVSITTRSEGEAVATVIKLKQSGGIASRSLTSHPIGTTVLVLNFLSKVIVRKEVALKGSKRALSEIKEILKSYALARVNLRLSLKVLKTEKANWSFYARPNNGIRDVVTQVIGRDTAAQCIERTSTVPGLNGNSRIGSSDGHCDPQQNQPFQFLIQAFLPISNADVSKIGGGQYISVDSRPVSCSRGVFKKIASAYKSHIQAIAANPISKVQNPFIRLNIICEDGSYDPNIEPAKDNVLFEDEDILLAAVDNLLRTIYGNISCPRSMREKSQVDGVLENSIARSDLVIQKGYNVLFSPEPLSAIKAVRVHPDSSAKSEKDGSLSAGDNRTRKDESHDRSVLKGLPHRKNEREPCSQRPNEGHKDPNNGHPDLLPSAITSPVMVHQHDSKMTHLNPQNITNFNASNSRGGIGSSSITHVKENRSSKRPSFVPFTSPPPCRFSEPEPWSDCHHSSRLRRLSNHSVPALNGLQMSLDDWFNRNDTNRSRKTRRLQFHGSQLTADVNGDALSLNKRHPKDSEDPTQEVDSFCKASARQRLPIRRKSREPSKPLVSPLSFPQLIHQDRSTKLQRELHSVPSRWPQPTNGRSETTVNANSGGSFQWSLISDVEDALDFEGQNEEATRNLRSDSRNLGTPANLEVSSITTSSLPRPLLHQGRYKAAIAAPSAKSISSFESIASHEKKLSETSFADGDQRVNLMGSKKFFAVDTEKEGTLPKLKRINTMPLPLETIPERAKLHNLAKVVSVDINSLGKAVSLLVNYDQYSKSGFQAPGFLAPSDLPKIEETLQGLFKRRLQGTPGSEGNRVMYSFT